MNRPISTLAALAVAALLWIGIAIIAASGRGEVKPSIEAGGWLRDLGRVTGGMEQALRGVIDGLPTVSHDAAAAVKAALAATPAGREAPMQLLLVAGVLASLILLSKLVDWQFSPAIKAADASEQDTSVFLLLVRDAIDVALLVLAAFVAVRLLFPGADPLDRLAVGMLWGFVRWWAIVKLVNIVLRPDWPRARLVPVFDAAARNASWIAALALALGIAFISTVPVLLGGGLSAPSARALALLIGVIEGALILAALGGVFAGEPRPPRWLRITLPLVVGAVVLVWSLSVLLLEFSAYHAIVQCLQAIAGAYILDRLLVVGANGIQPIYATAARRVIWLATAASVLFGLAKLILVSLLHMLTPEAWAKIERGYTSAFLILVVGFALYEALKAWAKVQFGAGQVPSMPGDEVQAEAASRVATVMPIVMGFGGSLILVISTMLALGELGVSIGPLIAGAGIIGLAFSFGSQALVRDIVSGMFYMVDDAFRIGEYVDTGRHKGTVERISLRSVRLRHQDGQVHNVPYGQFGAVTNFSRDWVTMKFNLRLGRNADIEQVRKIAKRLGQEMLTDPELGPDFLLPLKLHGLADVQENALILRFKFTVKPIQPTIVRREVMKRLFLKFREEGIAFAMHSVTVHAADAGEKADAAAASGQLLAAQQAVVRVG